MDTLDIPADATYPVDPYHTNIGSSINTDPFAYIKLALAHLYPEAVEGLYNEPRKVMSYKELSDSLYY